VACGWTKSAPLSFLARSISVDQINHLRGLLLPGSLPLGRELLLNLSTAIRHSFVAAWFVFAAFGVLNFGKPRTVWLVAAAAVYLGISYLNGRYVERTILSSPSIEQVQKTFLRSFALLTLQALILGLMPWLVGSSMTAYGELLTTLIVIGYCLLFAVMHSVFPMSVLSFSLINCVAVSTYWISTHYDFKWPMAFLTLVFFGFLFIVTLNFGRVLRKALSLQIERDEARVRAEDAARGLEDALANLKRVNLEKLRSFGAANHDLRQPISAISLFVGVLQRKLKRRIGDDAEIKDLIEKVDRNLATLDVIVGSLSDLTSLETGGFSVRPEVFELRELVQELAGEFEGQGEVNGTRIQVLVPVLNLFSDPRMLARIIRNALDNAIKYAGGRPVIVSVIEEPSAIYLSVRDFGPGIPEALRARVIDAYIQLDNPERDRKKGYGLGLSIAKRMADALGSHIELREPEGGGLEFLVEIASLVSSQPNLEVQRSRKLDGGFEAINQNLRRLSIVVVDDDDDVRIGLEALFEAWGQRVRGFSNIEQATYHLSSLREADQPDHIFIDNWLPDGRGIDAVNTFRAHCPHARLTLLTGDTDAKTLSRATELDIKVLLKPVTAERLAQLLNSAYAL
jgi:two-component system, sensor histidine kinase